MSVRSNTLTRRRKREKKAAAKLFALHANATNLQLKDVGLLKYVSPFSGHHTFNG